MKSGNLVVFFPGEKQKYTFKTESSSLWCHFSGQIIEELMDSCGILGGVYFLKQNKMIFEAYAEMIRRFNQPGRQLSANASFFELVYCISDNIRFFEQIDSDAVLPVLTYINSNYNKHLTLGELAKKSGYSKSRFSHLFSEIVGTSPIKYQNDIRLKVSCEMLISTKMTISAIAYSCGFSDPLYYSRIFKQKYNMSPTDYRLNLS